MPDTQYFTNIDGKYVKDAEARQQLNDLEDYVESLDQPWQPLQDGYSNFWFELTNDTLSPWLNFSAKTENAVIDWGDGSGEQALDTLTPTHTYSKAGRYVVKVKGVTGIAQQHTSPLNNTYIGVLKYAELNSEVSSLANDAFNCCINLQDITFSQSCIFGNGCFTRCCMIKELSFPESMTSIPLTSCYMCVSLGKVTIPSGVTTINNYTFNYCYCLNEIHIKPTSPPSISNTSFGSLPSNFVMYVPVGTADTYKAASGWSTYADHILEEGQQPNRMMLAKFKEETDEPQDDMR